MKWRRGGRSKFIGLDGLSTYSDFVSLLVIFVSRCIKVIYIDPN